MVINLKVGDTADDEKKKHCTVSLDTVDDKKQALEHSIAGLETRITKTECVLEATKVTIGALEDAIKALDRMPAEATEQRKEEKRELHGAPGARLRRSHEGACGTAREDSKTLANKEAAHAEMQSLLESHTESCEARQGQPKEQPCGDRRALGPSRAGGPVVSHGSGCRWAGGSGIGGAATAMLSGTWPGSARPNPVPFAANPGHLALEVGSGWSNVHLPLQPEKDGRWWVTAMP